MPPSRYAGQPTATEAAWERVASGQGANFLRSFLQRGRRLVALCSVLGRTNSEAIGGEAEFAANGFDPSKLTPEAATACASQYLRNPPSGAGGAVSARTASISEAVIRSPRRRATRSIVVWLGPAPGGFDVDSD